MSRFANSYLQFPRASYSQFYYVDAMDTLREFRSQRDLILTLCGAMPPGDIAEIEFTHAVEDMRQRKLLSNDPAVAERWGEELRRIADARIARPEAQRQGAIALVKSIAGQDAVVEYLYTQQTRESYAVGLTLFEIERTTDTLTMINEVPRHEPTDPRRVLDMTPRFTGDELELKAREFASKYAPAVKLGSLLLERHQDEGSHYYWFRWYLPDNYGRFVQIAYTPAGDIVAYSITLPGY